MKLRIGLNRDQAAGLALYFAFIGGAALAVKWGIFDPDTKGAQTWFGLDERDGWPKRHVNQTGPSWIYAYDTNRDGVIDLIKEKWSHYEIVGPTESRSNYSSQMYREGERGFGEIFSRVKERMEEK